jgi:hypothetical protein
MTASADLVAEWPSGLDVATEVPRVRRPRSIALTRLIDHVTGRDQADAGRLC